MTTETTLPLPPGPKGRPLMGSLPEMRKERLRFLMQLREEYGDVVSFRLGPVNACLVAHPDDVLHVLGRNSDNYHKSPVYKKLAFIGNTSVLVTEGEQWHRQRRMMNPHFRRQTLNSYAEMMTRTTSAMVDRWLAEIEPGESIELMTEMSALTLSIVCYALFSVDISTESAEAGEALSIILENASKRLQTGVAGQVPLLDKLPTPSQRRFQEAAKTLDNIFFAMIDERRKNGPQEDLLSALVFAEDEEGGPAMDDQELRDQIVTLFIAGHETTATTLTWTFALLSQHPESERKLHAELVAAIGDRLPTIDDLPQMSYSQYVIEEALRLYPPVPVIARTALADDTLGGYHIPAGTSVLLSQEVTHHHPDFWDNPEGFDPERFSLEASKGRPHFAFFPFGGGPRRCIGDNFATLELRLVVPIIAQRLRLELVPGHPVKPSDMITQRPEGGTYMTIHWRE